MTMMNEGRVADALETIAKRPVLLGDHVYLPEGCDMSPEDLKP